MQSGDLNVNHFDAMKDLGIMGFYAANITPIIYKTITSNGLKLFPYQIDAANNSIVKYTDAIYTKWEAEGKGDGSNGDVQLFHTGIGKDTNEGSTHYIITKAGSPDSELINGPGYYQYVRYKQIEDNKDITYKGNYHMKIKRIGKLPENFGNDEVCEIQIVASNPEYNVKGTPPRDKIFYSYRVNVDTFLTAGWDVWKDISIHPYTLKTIELFNLAEKQKRSSDTIPAPHYDSHYMQFKIIWKGLSYLRLCVDYIETYDQRGEYLIINHKEDDDIKKLVGEYNDTSYVLGYFGLNEPSSIDNYEPFRYIENLIKGATFNKLHLFTTFTTGWNGTFGGQWAGEMNFDVYKGSEFIKRTKLPYVSLNTYIYNYPYSPSEPFPNGPYYLRNIVEVTDTNLKKLNAAGIPFSYSTQSGTFYSYDDYCNNQFKYYVNPTSAQMMYHINLGMLYGAKELTCDPLFTLLKTEKCIGLPYRDGLAEVNKNGYTLSALGETWKKYVKPRLAGLFGQTLKKITQSGQYPDISFNKSDRYDFITSIGFDPVGSNENNIVHPGYDLGFFKGEADIKYFMLLRRWYQTDHRDVIIRYDLSSTGYKNYKLFNYIDSTFSYKRSIDTIKLSVTPGDGRLLSLAPVAKYGGEIRCNENIYGTNTLSGEMRIKSGAVLMVNGVYNIQKNIIIEAGGEMVISQGAVLNFIDGAAIIKNGGTLTYRGNPVVNLEIQ
jgi:hypothetical protein